MVLTDFNRFLEYLEEPLVLPLTLRINGQLIEVLDESSAKQFEADWYEPLNYFERKFLIFRDVDSEHPKKCRH